MLPTLQLNDYNFLKSQLPVPQEPCANKTLVCTNQVREILILLFTLIRQSIYQNAEIFCHGIPFFSTHKIDFFSHENVQYDKPCCTDDNMDGECMDQSCAWKQPCEYVVASTITYHDLVTLTVINTISTIVISINTASTCTAITFTNATIEYLFTSTISQ